MSTDNQSAQSATSLKKLADNVASAAFTYGQAERDVGRPFAEEAAFKRARDKLRAGIDAALAQAPAPSDVYPCVKLTVSEDGSVAASLYAPGLPAGVFNVYPLGIEDVSTGAPAPSGEAPNMLAICEALGFDPTNHHNAAKCPYCRPPTERTEPKAEPPVTPVMRWRYRWKPEYMMSGKHSEWFFAPTRPDLDDDMAECERLDTEAAPKGASK